MSDPTWDGVTTSEAFQEAEAALRHKLADAAKAYDWPQVLDILSERAELVNSARPDSESRYSVLHQAAHGGAPEEVVERLLSYGAWRTLRTLQGERAVEIAQRKGHAHLIPQLTPVLAREVVPGLNDIQHHFHLLIRQRMVEYQITLELRLPELEPLLELEKPVMWFPVPGMYGGFSYELSDVAGDAVLICTSWSRVMGGGQRHLISPYGSLLLTIPPWL